MSHKKNRTTFSKAYTDQYPFILSSKNGETYAFCSTCSSDFSILHRGKGDIVKHVNTDKHERNVKILLTNKKIDVTKNSSNEYNVIRAETYFTSFIVEHNIAISAADHAGPLFRKMFPDSQIAKKYGCARTKSTAIVKEMAQSKKECIVDILRKSPFSIATDGSNKSDSKLYPICVTYYNEDLMKIETSLLCAPVLNSDGTGLNIAQLLLSALGENNIDLDNCLALGADNAPVMIGRKAGVAGILTDKIPNLCVIGCPCHLLNLAAEKGAAKLPVCIEEYIIDIFYYLDKSSKRKEKLKQFQKLHDIETRKLLKHISTRWLSLGRSLNRLLEQWEPLVSFFKNELKTGCNSNNALKEYKIPKKDNSSSSDKNNNSSEPKNKSSESKKNKSESKKNKSSESKDNSSESKKDNLSEAGCSKIKSANTALKKRCIESTTSSSKKLKLCKEFDNDDDKLLKNILSREERIFMFLTSDLNKAFCYFLLHTTPLFEEPNVQLQSGSPQIHALHDILLTTLKNIIIRFVTPSVIKSSAILDVNYHSEENQRLDSDLIIGQASSKIVETLKSDEKKEFFRSVRSYFITVCDYMIHKFPFKDEVLLNAKVLNLSDIESASFSNVKFFCDRFPVLRNSLQFESTDKMVDELQIQFCSLQLEVLPEDILTESRMDIKWAKLSNSLNNKYKHLCEFMLALLTLPHSNAECERVFSLVTKTQTQFRSQLSNENLESLLTVKSKMRDSCFEQTFSDKFLKQAKSCTLNSLN